MLTQPNFMPSSHLLCRWSRQKLSSEAATTARLAPDLSCVCFTPDKRSMGQNLPVAFRSGQRPFAHPLLPERTSNKRRCRALITSPSPTHTPYPSQKVTDRPRPARVPQDDEQNGNFWLWEATKGVANNFLDIVRVGRLPWTGETSLPASQKLEKAGLLGDTTRRAVEVHTSDRIWNVRKCHLPREDSSRSQSQPDLEI